MKNDAIVESVSGFVTGLAENDENDTNDAQDYVMALTWDDRYVEVLIRAFVAGVPNEEDRKTYLRQVVGDLK